MADDCCEDVDGFSTIYIKTQLWLIDMTCSG